MPSSPGRLAAAPQPERGRPRRPLRPGRGPQPDPGIQEEDLPGEVLPPGGRRGGGGGCHEGGTGGEDADGEEGSGVAHLSGEDQRVQDYIEMD